MDLAPNARSIIQGRYTMRELIGARHGRIQRSGFRPHPLMAGAHAQTIAPALLRPRPDVIYRIERMELPDGDFVDLGWAGEQHAEGPIAVLVHGLGGGLDSKYVRGLSWRLVSAGWRVVALQLRGGGPEPNRLARAYHHGDTADLRQLWHRLRTREPRSFIASVGWSLGGNVTLKALGEEGAHAPVDVACALSVPFRLQECADHIRKGFARLYQSRLLAACKAMVQQKRELGLLTTQGDPDRALRAADFFEFDDAFTAPLNGYADALDYYARASCGAYLGAIRVSTLILHALDDPFMVSSIVPAEESLSPAVTLELAERGGHVGFISSGPLGLPQAWSEAYLCKHLVDAYAAERRELGLGYAGRSA